MRMYYPYVAIYIHISDKPDDLYMDARAHEERYTIQ